MITAAFPLLKVLLSEQRLLYLQDAEEIQSYAISSGEKGAGESKNSGKTPRGWHVIRAKIGSDLPLYSVFSARRPTGEIYTPALKKQYPDRDWILTRILWLSGLEVGKNRLGDCDTMQRYIYFHGCPDDQPMGVAHSHGCIRMRNDDIFTLFDKVPVGTVVHIQE